MTLATIAYTLDVLERRGLSHELPLPQFSRYESNREPHVILVCVKCVDVTDATVGQEMVARLKSQISSESNFQVAWQRVDFHGWCANCAANREKEKLSPV